MQQARIVFLVSGKISFEPRQCTAPSTLSILFARNQIIISINTTYQLSSSEDKSRRQIRIRNPAVRKSADPDPYQNVMDREHWAGIAETEPRRHL
jgi:hypothetical protein